MKLENFLRIGSFLQYLRLAMYVLPNVKGENHIEATIDKIRDMFDEEGFNQSIIGDLLKFKKKLDDYKPDENIKKDDADELYEIINNVLRETYATANNRHILEITVQSGLNPVEIEKIANKQPSEFIPEPIWTKLTDIEKSDFCDSAKCLLLGTATPSVMVALRGAEASVRNYYTAITSNDPGTKTWRQLCKELKDDAETLNISDTFIGYLDYYGDAKRNFAQHPNKIYTLREAVMIFIQVAALVEEIYTQI